MRTATCMLAVMVAAAVFSAATVLMAARSQAAEFHYVFPLDGLQEAPTPVVTPATGLGIVDYDDVTNLLEWNIHYQDLLGDANNAHFHGPADVGVPAGVRVPIPGSSGTSGDLIGSTTISDAFETELLAGLWYANVHSTLHSGGEIRGQVVPEPSTFILAALGLSSLAVLGWRRRSRPA